MRVAHTKVTRKVRRTPDFSNRVPSNPTPVQFKSLIVKARRSPRDYERAIAKANLSGSISLATTKREGRGGAMLAQKISAAAASDNQGYSSDDSAALLAGVALLVRAMPSESFRPFANAGAEVETIIEWFARSPNWESRERFLAEIGELIGLRPEALSILKRRFAARERSRLDILA